MSDMLRDCSAGGDAYTFDLVDDATGVCHDDIFTYLQGRSRACRLLRARGPAAPR
jgi:hypothetical protein